MDLFNKCSSHVFVMTVIDKKNPDKLFRIPVYMDNFIHPQSI